MKTIRRPTITRIIRSAISWLVVSYLTVIRRNQTLSRHINTSLDTPKTWRPGATADRFPWRWRCAPPSSDGAVLVPLFYRLLVNMNPEELKKNAIRHVWWIRHAHVGVNSGNQQMKNGQHLHSWASNVLHALGGKRWGACSFHLPQSVYIEIMKSFAPGRKWLNFQSCLPYD